MAEAAVRVAGATSEEELEEALAAESVAAEVESVVELAVVPAAAQLVVQPA